MEPPRRVRYARAMQAAQVALTLPASVGLGPRFDSDGWLRRVFLGWYARQQDAYFRPLLESPTLVTFAWRSARFAITHGIENRLSQVVLLAVIGKTPPDVAQLNTAYEDFHEQLSNRDFSEETVADIDYLIFTTFRCLSALLSHPPPRRAGFSDVFRLARTASRVELFLGAALLAVEQPSLVRNPLVLREIGRAGVREVDAYFKVLSKLGFMQTEL